MSRASRQARRQARISKQFDTAISKIIAEDVKQQQTQSKVVVSPTTPTYLTAPPPVVKRFVSSGGGGSSGASSQQLQQQIKEEQKYYGGVSSGKPNQEILKNLKKITLQRMAERLVQLKKTPLMAGRYLPGSPEYAFIGARGIQVGAGAFTEKVSEEQARLRTEIARENKPGVKQAYKKLSVQTLGVQKGIVRAVGDTAGLIALVPKLPKATFLFLTNQPLQKIVTGIKNFTFGKVKLSAKKVIKQVRSNPAEAVSYVMTQYFLFGGKATTTKGKAVGKIEKFIIKDTATKREGLFFKWVGKQRPVLVKFRTDLNANMNKVKISLNKAISKLKIGKKTSGQTELGVKYLDIGKIDVPKPKPKPIPKVKIIKPRVGKDIELTFKPRGYDTLALEKQVKFAGKKLNLVSAQADRLVYLLRKSRLVQKPIAELKLTKKGVNLLNKFNQGKKLTIKEIKFLNQEFKRTNKGLLAKTFFASPGTQVRVSRLGLRGGNAGLVDIFKGKFVLKRSKPQILFFRNQRIQKFPKDLTTIRNKLLTGKSLTQNEATQLLNFQLKKSGRFKPIGFVTREAEVTLSPGEIIRRVKRLGSVRIAGRKVSIIEAEVSKIQSKVTKELMIKLNKGARLTKEEIRKMNKGIQKESGFKSSSYSSYSGKPKPYLNLKSKLLNFSIYYKGGKPISYYPKGGIPPSYPKGGIPPSYPKGGTPTPYIPTGGKPTPYIPTGGIYPPKGGYPPYKPPFTGRTKPPVKKVPHLTSKFPYKSTNNIKVGYYAYGLSGKKYVKLNKKPLSKQDALSRGSYAIDRTTAKTFKIVPVLKVKKLGNLAKREKGYYTKTARKFREYRVKKGKAYALILKQIEKRKYGIDTTGEKKGLSLAKYLSKLKKRGY